MIHHLGQHKIIQLDERFATGEPTVQPVLLWGLRGKPCYEPLSKEASQSPALEYIRSVEPIPGRTIVLVIGLGSYEWYGTNRNGDGFPEQPYKPGQKPTCGCCGDGRDAWVLEEECIQFHYKSYEQGHVFRHHVNKDPKKRIGNILKSFWNPYMHRIEVLEDIENDRAPDLVEQISDGEFPPKSMGCFCQGTLITTDTGLEAIEDVQPGTKVLTLKGSYKPIKSCHKRAYNAPIYVIRTATGVSSATGEHPYAVLSKEIVEEKTSKGNWRRKQPNQISIKDTKWVHAECLKKEDYLITPINTAVEETLTIDECRLLGYYIADGYVIFRNQQPYGIEFIHNKNGTATQELPLLLSRLVPDTNVPQRPHPDSQHAIITACYNNHVAKLCYKHAGHLAHNKQLSLELMQQPKKQQLTFLGAWINCDGGSCTTADFYISSCNKSLINQARHMGLRWGLYSRLATIPHKPSTIVKKETVEYRADFSRRGCNIIKDYTVKVNAYTINGSNTGPFFIEGAIVAKIKEIGHLEFNGTVYNLELEDGEDPSYVAEGHAVHNCRIKFDVCTDCGHMAPTRKHYCDHLKWEMGQLNPKTGIRKGMLNPAPKLFDSSWVIRPADRTGYMMKKVAYIYEVQGGNMSSSELGDLVDELDQKTATAHKLAVIDKVVRGYPAGIVKSDVPEAPLIEKYRQEIAPQISANTQELPHQDLATLAPFNLAHVLSALSQAGIILTTPEMVQLFIEKALPGTQIPREVLDNLVGLQSEFFELFKEHPSMLKDLQESLIPANGTTPMLDTHKEALDKAIEPLLEKRSTLEPYLYRRLTPRMFRHEEAPLSDTLGYQDPSSGRVFQTTRGAAQKAEDAIGQSKLHKLLGSGGLLAAALKSLTALNTAPAAIPLAAGSYFLGRSALTPPPTYRTLSGEDVPYLTEFREKRSSLIDITNNLAMDYGLTKQGSRVIQRIQSRTTPNHPLHLFMQKLSSFGLYYPELTLHKVITNHEKTAQNGIIDDQLDLQKTAEVIGTLVWATSWN